MKKSDEFRDKFTPFRNNGLDNPLPFSILIFALLYSLKSEYFFMDRSTW